MFCINCGQDNNLSKLSFGNNKLTGWIKNHKKSILIFIGIVTLLFIIVSISGDNFSKIENSSYNQIVDASAVVNIFCPSIVSDEESSGGWGTIISSDGNIITNPYFISQQKKKLRVY